MSTNKQVFVAYAYGMYDKRDYRKIFTDIEIAFDVKFIFADEKITNMHIMQKIISYIKSSDFSLFDISGWNPNVTLELGFAMATSDNWYICFNPDKTPQSEVPSDIKGIDRIQYKSFSEFKDQLTAIIEQRYPKKNRQPLNNYLEALQEEALNILGKQSDLKMIEIAEILQVSIKVAQLVINPLVGTKIKVIGKTKGAKYSLVS
ncbi:hypothetical protein CH370_09555 [Leptospira kmetyi]|uniref:hypothetical protein n=1 Tax=Leptospira kmetyi TaxID=408139 RepID=UPI000C29E9CA|nr:hypothetical protein [Leptospira kmetyi]PJZ41678.1 hypothetical protein CH370_09555 [Leptospira kmetyi]